MEQINYADMVHRLAKPGAAICATMTPFGAHILHMAVGISGEAGELLSAIANLTVFGNALDKDNVVEELGDMEFYMEGLRAGMGITREECLQVKADAVAFDNLLNSIMISITAGDLLDLVKKATIHSKNVDRFKILQELGRLEVYMDGLRTVVGLTREQCIQANVNKLVAGANARYASGQYSDEQAHARADKQATGETV